MKLKDTR